MAIRVDGPRTTTISETPEVNKTSAATPTTEAPRTQEVHDQLTTGGAPLQVQTTQTPGAQASQDLNEARDMFRALSAQVGEAGPGGQRVAGFLEMSMPSLDRPLTPAQQAAARQAAKQITGGVS